MSTPDLGIERHSIITLSTAHLHPATRETLARERGEIAEGPSIAVREEGFLVNSHISSSDVLDQDMTPGLYASLHHRMPDLVLVRALARGLQAAWINFDVDGPVQGDILPTYDDCGAVTLPSADGWRDALSDVASPTGHGDSYVVPSREILEMIEAGQTPALADDGPGMS